MEIKTKRANIGESEERLEPCCLDERVILSSRPVKP